MANVAAMRRTGINHPPATPGELPSKAAGHRPVLLHLLIEHLQPHPGDVAVDGTLGAGGVTAELLARVSGKHGDRSGRVIAIDRDPEAVAHGRRRFAGEPVTVVHDDFINLDHVLRGLGLDGVDIVTLDLGISSLQLDDPERGFSFRFDGPLDMRMDPSTGTTAADIVNTWERDDLALMIRTYGEERFARSIASTIVRKRSLAPLTTTADLRRCAEEGIPRSKWPNRIHPATRTFQALRIAVNDELRSIEQGLQAAIRVLRPGGRLGVIAFHSLEDVLVKNALHVSAKNCVCPPQQPLCTCAHRATLFLPTRRAIKPDAEEIAANPRARSARLRVAVKLDISL